jgi:hypothetical protein
MNKKLLILAVAGAFAASGSAFAAKDMNHGAGATVNGHVFSVFALTNDGAALDSEVPGINSPQIPGEKSFHTDAEINIRGMVAEDVYARVDLDYNPSGDPSSVSDGIEQAYGMWKAHDMVKVQIGRFNNPLGIEAHDQANLQHFITHGQVRHAFNDIILSGGSDGNNIEGVAAHVMAGPAKLSLGLLNDIGDVPEENSFLLNISAAPVEGLDLALGVITQDDDETNVGNVINFNAAFGMDTNNMPIKVWLDYLTAAEFVDSVISLGGSIGFEGGFGVALRYDMTSYADDTDETSITLAGSWSPADNFDLRFEWRNDEFENGTSADGDSIALAAAFRF